MNNRSVRLFLTTGCPNRMPNEKVLPLSEREIPRSTVGCKHDKTQRGEFENRPANFSHTGRAPSQASRQCEFLRSPLPESPVHLVRGGVQLARWAIQAGYVH